MPASEEHRARMPKQCCGCQPFGIATVAATSTPHALSLIRRSRRIYVRVSLSDRMTDDRLFKVGKLEALGRIAEPLYSGKPPAVRFHLGTYRGEEMTVIGAL